MYILNNDKQNTPSVDYKKWLKRLDTQLNETIKIQFNKSSTLKKKGQNYHYVYQSFVYNITPNKFSLKNFHGILTYMYKEGE